MSPTPRVISDPAELVALFLRDRGEHVYAIADLEEPYWSASTWWRVGDAAVGVVGLPEGGRVVYCVSTADQAGTLALVRTLSDQLPSQTLITGPTGVAQALQDAGRAVLWHGGYHRYVYGGTTIGRQVEGVVPLSPRDRPEIDALYERGAAFFLPSMLDTESFVGVRSKDGLIAIAGAHVVSQDHRLAAIGGVFVDPDYRGRNLGELVTRGAMARLGDRVDVIGLNCADENIVARRIYERIGFEATLAYEECEVGAA